MLPLPVSATVLLQLDNLPSMVQGVYSEDVKQQLEATTQFRKLLSIGALTWLQKLPGASLQAAA